MLADPLGGNKILLHTDGGISAGGMLTAAAIVEDPAVRRIWKIAGIKNGGRPHESEGVAGLLGIATARALQHLQLIGDMPIVWYSDSTFSQTLTDSINASSESLVTLVHASHAANKRRHEACHRVCRWLQFRSDKIFAVHGAGKVGITKTHQPENAWIILELAAGIQKTDPLEEIAMDPKLNELQRIIAPHLIASHQSV